MTGNGEPNARQAEDWNGVEGTHWVEHEARYDAMLRPFLRAVLRAAGLRPGERVLDIGCGCGDTSLAAAREVGPAGEVGGVDLSAAMLSRARQRARDERLDHVHFEQGDAQIHPFAGGHFDAAISRFGVMFFADPVAAFANVGRALVAGGRLAFACWQDLGANEWLLAPAMAVARHLPLPDLGEPDAPGPFAFADADRLRRILEGAGFADVAITPCTTSIVIAGDVDDVVGFMRQTGMARRLFEGAAPGKVDEAVREVRDALTPYATPDGVRLGAAAWIATATRPG